MEWLNKYELTPEREKELLRNAIIVFDTSALLDLYYYSENTRHKLFENVFEKIKDRLWIPAQVAFEFSKNRKNVLLKPIQSYKDLMDNNTKNNDSGHISKILSLREKIKWMIVK